MQYLNVKMKMLHTFFLKKQHVAGKFYVGDMKNMVSVSLDLFQ